MIIKFTPKERDEKVESQGVIHTEELAPDLESLYDYLKRALKMPMLECEEIAEDTLGFSDDYQDIDFDIYYQPRQHCEIEVYEGEEELLKKLKTAIDPLMWGPLPDSRNEHNYCAPVLKFNEDGATFLVYETYAPETYLKNMLEQHFSGIRPLENMQVLYPYIDSSIYDKPYKYGEYCPYAPSLNGELIDCMTESEIAYSLWYLRDLKENLNADGELTPVLERRMKYIESYLFQKTADFGVEPNAPSTIYRKPNKECEDWYKWWVKGFNKMIKEHGEEFTDWCHRAQIGEACPFRPEGDYLDIFLKNK